MLKVFGNQDKRHTMNFPFTQDGFIKQRGPGWKFLGQKLCFTAFLIVSGMSKRKCNKFMAAIKSGQVVPPEDGRSERTFRDTPKRQHAEAFFQYLYDHLAEPLAEGEPDPEADDDDETAFQDEFSYWVRGEARRIQWQPLQPQQNQLVATFLRSVLVQHIFSEGFWINIFSNSYERCPGSTFF